MRLAFVVASGVALVAACSVLNEDAAVEIDCSDPAARDCADGMLVTCAGGEPQVSDCGDGLSCSTVDVGAGPEATCLPDCTDADPAEVCVGNRAVACSGSELDFVTCPGTCVESGREASCVP